MTPSQAETAMRSKIDAFIPLKNKLQWPNRVFTPPTSGVWGRVSFLSGAAFIAGLADAPVTRHTGILTIELFDAKDVGEAAISNLADQLGEHLNYYMTGGLELLAYSKIRVGLDQDFYKINVQIPYRIN